jgi:protocatechuate 3,4-dioxygenase beta subunit
MKTLVLFLLIFLTACASTSPASTPTSPAQSLDSTPSSLPATPSGDLFAIQQIELPAPACDGTTTPAQTEGPYYKAGSPERTSLITADTLGKRLIVAGYVLKKDCLPIPNAWLDFWQADANGVYDNQGYTLRGHQLTDSQGRYFLETIFPGEYPGRTQHLHVKVQAPGGPVLTSQLYFPDEPGNATDGIFDPRLIVKLENRGERLVAYFNFVIDQ